MSSNIFWNSIKKQIDDFDQQNHVAGNRGDHHNYEQLRFTLMSMAVMGLQKGKYQFPELVEEERLMSDGCSPSNAGQKTRQFIETVYLPYLKNQLDIEKKQNAESCFSFLKNIGKAHNMTNDQYAFRVTTLEGAIQSANSLRIK